MPAHPLSTASAIVNLDCPDDVFDILKHPPKGSSIRDIARMLAIAHPTWRVSWFLDLIVTGLKARSLKKMTYTEGRSLSLVPGEITEAILTIYIQQPVATEVDFGVLANLLEGEGGRACILPALGVLSHGHQLPANGQLIIRNAPAKTDFDPASVAGFKAGAGSLDEFVLIIPSYRSAAVLAAMEFHCALGVPTIAAVTEDLAKLRPPEGTKMVVSGNYAERILAALSVSDSRYVMVTGDDDFVYPKGLAAAVRHLSDYPEVAGVDGYGFDLHRRVGQYFATAKSPTCTPTADAETRLHDFFAGVCSFVNLVRRREHVLAAVSAFTENDLNPYFLEILMDYAGLVAGPTQQIAEMILVRSRVPTATATPTSITNTSLLDMLIDGEQNGLHRLMRSLERFHELTGLKWDREFARRVLVQYLSANGSGGRRRAMSTVRLGWLAEKHSQSYGMLRTFTRERGRFIQEASEFHKLRYV